MVAPVLDELLPRPGLRTILVRLTMAMGAVVLLGQAAVVARARPQDLITGARGMADILSRAFPPDIQNLRPDLAGVVETFDIALLGTCVAVLISVWLSASGWSDWTLIPYFAVKSVIIWP